MKKIPVLAVLVAALTFLVASPASATDLVATVKQECGPNGLTRVTILPGEIPQEKIDTFGAVTKIETWPTDGLYAPNQFKTYGMQVTFANGTVIASNPARFVVLPFDCTAPTTTTTAPGPTTTTPPLPGPTTTTTLAAATTTTIPARNVEPTIAPRPTTTGFKPAPSTTSTTVADTSDSTITTPNVTLPRTGDGSTALIPWAIVFVAIGCVFVYAGRRLSA